MFIMLCKAKLDRKPGIPGLNMNVELNSSECTQIEETVMSKWSLGLFLPKTTMKQQ